jgi:hypothetical protein
LGWASITSAPSPSTAFRVTSTTTGRQVLYIKNNGIIKRRGKRGWRERKEDKGERKKK